MRKIYIIPCLLITLFSSCKDFLKEVDQDKMIPTQVEHYAALLFGEVYRVSHFGSEIMTDNIEEYKYSLESSRRGNKTLFTWQREIELDENGNTINNNTIWTTLYKKIAIFNYVIEFADEIQGDKAEVDFVNGEALFLRAYYMFILNNLYGVPYRSESANFDLGIPIRTSTGILQTYDRASVANTYKQIISDLEKAKALFDGTTVEKPFWHPSVTACDMLLSRVYLYTEDWDKAIYYSTKVIESKKYKLSRTNTVKLVTIDNPEIIYTTSEVTPISPSIFNGIYKVSEELLSLYNEGDLRHKAYFSKVENLVGDKNFMPRRYDLVSTDYGMLNFQVSEAYLNRAEAYARTSKADLAKNDIRTLLNYRYEKPSQVVIPDTDILNVVLVERRKELCFNEYHRWFDLRRLKDEAPEVIHNYTITDSAGGETAVHKYTLYPSDKNYSLPIPLKERENNPLIYNNERYDKLPIEE